MEVTIDGISCVGTVEECKEFMNKIMNVCEQPTKINQSEEYVDLGLPSGKKWAKCNIGATKEIESGLYFQWGDVVGRTAEEIKDKPCNWNTTPFGTSKDFDKIKNMICPNGVLAKAYDAAYIHTEGKAHMPTREDFEELKANTTVTWEFNFNDSGVNGRKFTSKKDSSKYIFIPEAGFASGGSLDNRGSDGGILSSSFYSSSPNCAWRLVFYSGNLYILNGYRYYGYSVRGVMD